MLISIELCMPGQPFAVTATCSDRDASFCTHQVIDATWEPEEVSIPPHRRSVPLTLEQLKAQMPPQVESGSSSGSSSPWRYDDCEEEDEEDEEHDEFGRVKRMLSAFGPALTRLTANQALNTMQGKPMLCWLRSSPDLDHSWISNRNTLQERLRCLDEVTFKDNPQTWPPEDRDDLLGYSDEPFSFFGQYEAPKALQDLGRLSRSHPGPYPVYTTVENCRMECVLLRTTNSSCREADEEEEQQFYESTAASDADDFDMFLTFGREVSDFYVFLDPSRRRFTGRLKGTAAASGS